MKYLLFLNLGFSLGLQFFLVSPYLELERQTERLVFQISQEQLQMFLSFNFSGKQTADIVGVSRSTVKQCLRYVSIFWHLSIVWILYKVLII